MSTYAFEEMTICKCLCQIFILKFISHGWMGATGCWVLIGSYIVKRALHYEGEKACSGRWLDVEKVKWVWTYKMLMEQTKKQPPIRTCLAANVIQVWVIRKESCRPVEKNEDSRITASAAAAANRPLHWWLQTRYYRTRDSGWTEGVHDPSFFHQQGRTKSAWHQER